MGKIKIGVFGAGRGKTMIREMLNNPEAEVVAICDKYHKDLMGVMVCAGARTSA